MSYRTHVCIVLLLAVTHSPYAVAAEPNLGPWYQIGPFEKTSFTAAVGPERRPGQVDLNARHGRLAWKKAKYTDGRVRRLTMPFPATMYFYRTITCDRPTKLTTYYGSDDAHEVWLGGKKLISNPGPHGMKADPDKVVLACEKGVNHLLVKVWNLRGKSGFYFHTSANKGARKKGKTPRKKRPPRLPSGPVVDWAKAVNLRALRMAIEDLTATFGERYPKGREYLRRLAALEKTDAEAFGKLRREAMLANPLLDFDRLLVLKRDFGDRAKSAMSAALGMPKLNSHSNNHISNPEKGWDNELTVLSDLRGEGKFRTVYKPPTGRIVVDPDVHFDADRVMFSMIGDHGAWGVYEAAVQDGQAKRITPPHKDVDYYDSCYGPAERIYFTSTATMQGLPCQNGKGPVAQMYAMDVSAGRIRQVTFEQDTDWCPTMLPNGRVMYLRWEYTDLPHYFSRILMTMNPDGTGQMEYYGSNSYFPNGIFGARPIPGRAQRVVGIVGGHHGISRSGRMMIFDPAYGRHEAGGVVQEIPGWGKRVKAIIRDRLVDGVWPQLIHPYPLSEPSTGLGAGKYFLVSMKATPQSLWGLYLVDVFDNVTLIKEVDGSALLEPIPLRKTPHPDTIAEKVQPERPDAVVYLEDVYRGPGLAGVPRGAVKKLRLFSYHYGYNGTGGHASVGVESSWDIKRVLGTVPVESDGSALFRIPANTPISVQPLDEKGRALQLMRSWLVGMPGETLSCVGCHEPQNEAPVNASRLALRRDASAIAPWYGPARNFGFRREVQPTLDRYCVGCHNGSKKDAPDFTDPVGPRRRHSPAYTFLQAYVRRPGPESDSHLTTPMEYHASASELIQMLTKGHHNVRLDTEAWQRLYAWIDLNAPYYGSWAETGRLKEFRGVDQRKRRRELAKLYAGVVCDPEADDAIDRPKPKPILPKPLARPAARKVTAAHWPFKATASKQRHTLDLGDSAKLELVLVPAGEFVMGDAAGELDERPLSRVFIDKPFWMGTTEVTNGQYHQFDPAHDSRYIDNGGKDQSTRGIPANLPDQPVIRVSNHRAEAFCRWLSRKTGPGAPGFALPTEAQWEWACRAGTDTPLWYGDLDTDFSKYANMADATVLSSRTRGKKGGVTPFPGDKRFNDGRLIAGSAGGYAANPWGLHDMHGSVAEWTRTAYRPYPYVETDGAGAAAKKVVRGGSWRDRPKRCRSAFRLSYPPHQRIVNVGFRVVMTAESRGEAEPCSRAQQNTTSKLVR